MISLRQSFNETAEERAVKRTKPKIGYKPCPAEVYPNNKEHTMENEYYADTKKDKTEDSQCEKAYNYKSDITGGVTHLSCNHGIVKGFTALQRGESPLQVLAPALRRLPVRVKAKNRFFIYDNCCAAHKCALRRFPHRVRRWTFVIDRYIQLISSGLSQQSHCHSFIHSNSWFPFSSQSQYWIWDQPGSLVLFNKYSWTLIS